MLLSKCYALLPVRWDASHIYGGERVHAESLRVEGKSGRMCEMRLDADGNLPLDPVTGLPEGGAAAVCLHRIS